MLTVLQDPTVVLLTSMCRYAAAAGLMNWRLWVLSLCWFLVEASIYGILFWAPLLLDAIFVSMPTHILSSASAAPEHAPINRPAIFPYQAS